MGRSISRKVNENIREVQVYVIEILGIIRSASPLKYTILLCSNQSICNMLPKEPKKVAGSTTIGAVKVKKYNR